MQRPVIPPAFPLYFHGVLPIRRWTHITPLQGGALIFCISGSPASDENCATNDTSVQACAHRQRSAEGCVQGRQGGGLPAGCSSCRGPDSIQGAGLHCSKGGRLVVGSSIHPPRHDGHGPVSGRCATALSYCEVVPGIVDCAGPTMFTLLSSAGMLLHLYESSRCVSAAKYTIDISLLA